MRPGWCWRTRTFGAKLEEWLRTLRKKNAAVVLATQSLSEIANSPYRDVILESCPTKLYLPNAEARNPQTRELYRKFGLSDRQIDIIAEAAPKRDYYYVSPLGRRLFQFALGPAALAFIGAGSKEDVLAARRMIAEHGERWRVEWLRARGLGEWADYLDRFYPPSETPARSSIGADGYLNGDGSARGSTGMNGGGQGRCSSVTLNSSASYWSASAARRNAVAGARPVRRRTTIVFDPTMYARQLQQLAAGNRHRHQPGPAAQLHDQEHHRRRRRHLEVQPESAR